MNLYVHFPFCRSKCRYCALHSRVGVPSADRDAYVRHLADWLSQSLPRGLSLAVLGSVPNGRLPNGRLAPSAQDNGACPQADGVCPQILIRGLSPIETVYFGGGSPALCDLDPILNALAPYLTAETEFTVELHPKDVTESLLSRLRDGGVNRISMGLQSLDDATLLKMGRGYSVAEAAKAFRLIKKFFGNAGIDLIIGFPGDPCTSLLPLADWGLTHISIYSLQNERNLANVPSDDWVLDRIRGASAELASIGLKRYEISNYARPGFECRHNLAVWRGEDYLGLGEGAYGRLGRLRTKNLGVCPQNFGVCPQRTACAARTEQGACPQDEGGLSPSGGGLSPEVEEVTEERDALERRIFRLRTCEGLDARGRADWGQALERFCAEGLLTNEDGIYRLTPRGTEVCDSILCELV